MTIQPPLILASGSRYRRELLSRLGLPFLTASPDIDESVHPGELPQALARRLAREKALAVAAKQQSPSAHQPLIIGSDQVADCAGAILGKPGSLERATEQLRAASGRTVTFWTGLALINSQTGKIQEAVVRCDVEFRTLTDNEILRYLESEQPFDCAGSFKAEGLGIILFRRLITDDPTSLVGLPLIELCNMLRTEGVELPAPRIP